MFNTMPLRTTSLSAKIALFAASSAFVLLFALTLVGGMTTASYSHVSQFISEFGASGAPKANVFSWAGFFPVGVLVCVAAIGLWRALPRSKLVLAVLSAVAVFGISYIVSAVYPCDAGCQPANPSRSQVIHDLVGLFAYLCLPPALFAFGWRSRRWPNAKYPTLLATVAGTMALLGLVTLFTTDKNLGLVQRAMECAFFVWLISTASYAMRESLANA
jgi:Protein of unknown function (DUF998)